MTEQAFITAQSLKEEIDTLEGILLDLDNDTLRPERGGIPCHTLTDSPIWSQGVTYMLNITHAAIAEKKRLLQAL